MGKMNARQIVYVNRARCKKCGDIIESKSVHDFKQCKCGAIFTDGGKDYIRRGSKDLNDIEDLSLTTYDIKLGSDPTYFWDKFKPAFTWEYKIKIKDVEQTLIAELLTYDAATLPDIAELKEIVTDYVRWDPYFTKKGMSIVNRLLKEKYQLVLPTREFPVKLRIHSKDNYCFAITRKSVEAAQSLLKEMCEIALKGENLWKFVTDNMFVD